MAILSPPTTYGGRRVNILGISSVINCQRDEVAKNGCHRLSGSTRADSNTRNMKPETIHDPIPPPQRTRKTPTEGEFRGGLNDFSNTAPLGETRSHQCRSRRFTQHRVCNHVNKNGEPPSRHGQQIRHMPALRKTDSVLRLGIQQAGKSSCQREADSGLPFGQQ